MYTTLREGGGGSIAVPETVVEDFAYFTLNDLDAAKTYYDANGYVLIRRLVDEAACKEVRRAFDQSKNAPIPILRQHNMRYQMNRFNAYGHLANVLLVCGRRGTIRTIRASSARRLMVYLPKH